MRLSKVAVTELQLANDIAVLRLIREEREIIANMLEKVASQ